MSRLENLLGKGADAYITPQTLKVVVMAVAVCGLTTDILDPAFRQVANVGHVFYRGIQPESVRADRAITQKTNSNMLAVAGFDSASVDAVREADIDWYMALALISAKKEFPGMTLAAHREPLSDDIGVKIDVGPTDWVTTQATAIELKGFVREYLKGVYRDATVDSLPGSAVFYASRHRPLDLNFDSVDLDGTPASYNP